MIQRKNKRTAKIGIFAVVHEIYFEQFEGLSEKLYGYHNDLIDVIKANGVEVGDFGFSGNNSRAVSVPYIILDDKYRSHSALFRTNNRT